MRNVGVLEVLVIFVWFLVWGSFMCLGIYLRNRSNLRRLEMLHQERMAAMEKGIPLPELPDLNIRSRWWFGSPKNVPLAAGIVNVSLGVGGMAALLLAPDASMRRFSTLPLPLVFLGGGLLLYHFLTRDRAS